MFFKTLKEKMKFKTLKQVLFEDLQRNQKGLISQTRMFSQWGRIQETKRDLVWSEILQIVKNLNHYKDQTGKIIQSAKSPRKSFKTLTLLEFINNEFLIDTITSLGRNQRSKNKPETET